MKIFNAKQTSSAPDAEQLAEEIGIEADGFLRYRHPKAERVAALCEHTARLFSLGGEDRTALRIAALALDSGMLAMRRDYVARAGALTDDELADLARHPVVGEGEAARLGFNRAVQLLVRWHHEWWNGAGYPDHLRGREIPLPARILRVADTYAALTDDRLWRTALTRDEALELLRSRAGFEFDPAVVNRFLQLSTQAALISYASVAHANEPAANANALPPTPPLPPATTVDRAEVESSPRDFQTANLGLAESETQASRSEVAPPRESSAAVVLDSSAARVERE
jgi:HD-GYP domain-containing protein (c-di-GMP phosphodiesterase class II)